MPPPAATTLTALNWDAPVNTSNDITHVCTTEPPAATAPTPNTSPNTPTAAPSVKRGGGDVARRRQRRDDAAINH